ncbi:hypothetical protein IM792_13435 [Mucilaginibacter sp. JRF]|uniref:hypothetical protein n=1 Tax=Mucilaginibacter sp. JRF TaxID=2780088 RepID=UPI00187E1767|nr:hypothetical protein [Mucilaginibacter sp. JRF]MBE9585454.1 hypothetical protein [Mucilaginibacter sp. JRF]
MATERSFAIMYLRAVEKKNSDFFIANNLSIMDCVHIRGTALVSVHVINNTLPDSIVYEIETMFWKD